MKIDEKEEVYKKYFIFYFINKVFFVYLTFVIHCLVDSHLVFQSEGSGSTEVKLEFFYFMCYFALIF